MKTSLISCLPALLMSVVMTVSILAGIDSLSGDLRAEAATEIAQQQQQQQQHAGAADAA